MPGQTERKNVNYSRAVVVFLELIRVTGTELNPPEPFVLFLYKLGLLYRTCLFQRLSVKVVR